MLGKQLILWQVEYDRDAYVDQMGISHGGNVVIEKVPVIIVEEKKVPGDYGGNDDGYKGYRAESVDGRNFVINWETYPEYSSTPMYFWHPLPFPANEYVEYVDAIQAYNSRCMVYVRDNLKPRPNSDFYCAKHDKCFMNDEVLGCWRCHIENALTEAREIYPKG